MKYYIRYRKTNDQRWHYVAKRHPASVFEQGQWEGSRVLPERDMLFLFSSLDEAKEQAKAGSMAFFRDPDFIDEVCRYTSEARLV